MRRARLPARRRGKGEGIVVSGQKRVNGRFRLPGRQRQPAVDPPDDRYTIFMKTPRRQLLGLAVLAALAFAGCGDDKPSRAEPGIWLAITSPGPLERPVGHAAPLRVFNAVTGQERSFGPAARYVVVAWAPRGDRLAAFGVEDPTAEDAALVIRIWDAGGDVVATTTFDSGDGRDLPPTSPGRPTGRAFWSGRTAASSSSMRRANASGPSTPHRLAPALTHAPAGGTPTGRPTPGTSPTCSTASYW